MVDCWLVWQNGWLLACVTKWLIVSLYDKMVDCWLVWQNGWLLVCMTKWLIVGLYDKMVDCWLVWQNGKLLVWMTKWLIFGLYDKRADCQFIVGFYTQIVACQVKLNWDMFQCHFKDVKFAETQMEIITIANVGQVCTHGGDSSPLVCGLVFIWNLVCCCRLSFLCVCFFKLMQNLFLSINIQGWELHLGDFKKNTFYFGLHYDV